MKSSLCLVLPALLATLLPLPLMAQSSPVFDQFSYQGRVTDANGALIGLNSPVSRKITIKIYDASTNGTLLFAEEQNAIILNGEFSIIVGGGTLLTPPNKRLTEAVTGTIPSNGYWLGVTVDDGTAAVDPEITPRQKIIAAPFAVRAATADNVSAVSQDIRLNNKSLLLSTGTDVNAALRMATGANEFNSTLASGGGPILYGQSGGILGTTNGGNKAALQWGENSVNITNRLGINGNALSDETLSVKPGLGQDYALTVRNRNNDRLLSVETSGPVNVHNLLRVYGNIDMPGGGRFNGNVTGNLTGNVTGNATSANTATLATAAGKLEANGASYLNDKYLYLRSDANHGLQYAASPIDGPRLFGFGGGALGSGGTANALVWKADGNVGIGTTIPVTKLHVEAPSNKTTIATTRAFAVLSQDANNPFGLDVRLVGAANLADRGVIMQSTDINQADGGNILMQRWGGNVGIGTPSPKAPLHVVKLNYVATDGRWGNPAQGIVGGNNAGYGIYTGSLGGNFDVATGAGISGARNTTVPFGALAAIFEGETITRGSVWIGSSVSVSSDRRAKNVIGLSNGAADLKLVQQLRITDYNWIDRTKDQHRPHKQLIAQDVKEVFPQAVQQLPTEEPIPTVYEPAVKLVHDAAAGLLHITTKKEHGFKAGDAVDLYGEKEDGDLTNVKVAAVKDAHEFSVKSEKPVGKVFVYGKRVTDFLTVDYDAIAMLNVSATQEIKKELDAEVKERDAEIKELRAENATLRAALEKVQASFETRLAALEGPQPESGAEGAVKTVSTVTRKPAVSTAR